MCSDPDYSAFLRDLRRIQHTDLDDVPIRISTEREVSHPLIEPAFNNSAIREEIS